jgi:hypothetical protein
LVPPLFPAWAGEHRGPRPWSQLIITAIAA